MTQVLAAVLIVMGVGLMVWGARITGPGAWAGWAMTYLVAFRKVVVGACFVAAGIGLACDITWLLAASVCVGIGEFLESSYYISVIRWGQART